MKTLNCKDCKWNNSENRVSLCPICKDYDCFELEKSDREKQLNGGKTC